MVKKLRLLIFLVLLLIILPGVGCRLTTQQHHSPSSIIHDGVKRIFYLRIPASYDETKPTPLLMVLHGGGGTAKKMNKLVNNGFNALADQQGFIVLYPQGLDNHWNDGRKALSETSADDVGFLSVLIDYLASEYNIDRQRVYATGISNGGFMAFRLACELSE